MKDIYASIELNNQNIRLVVAELIRGNLYLLAAKEIFTNGIDRGRIIDFNVVSKDIEKVKTEVELMIGIKLNKVITLVSAERAYYQLVKGYTTVTNEFKKITPDDISRALQASVYNRISEKLELITIMPVDFEVDDIKVENPINQIGDKLSVRGIMVTVPKENVYGMVQALGQAGLETVDIGISGVADYYYLFNQEENNKRGIIVNINTDITTISYFNKGLIVNSEVIHVGVNNIIKDLAYVFNLHYIEASRLLERFAIATTRLANINEIITIRNKEQIELTLNQYEVSEVVMARLVEIFKLTKMSIKNLTKKEISYIMFTGVASEIPGFTSLLSETVGSGIKIGNSKTMGARNNAYVSVLGNIYYYVHKMKLKGKASAMYQEVKTVDVKSPKNGMMDKIFNYFKED